MRVHIECINTLFLLCFCYAGCKGCNMLQVCKAVKGFVLNNGVFWISTLNLSTSSHVGNNVQFRRRWVTPDKWEKANVKGKKLPWQPNLPRKRVEDQWDKDKPYFGMYDFMFLLGDDVTLQPKLFCKGPNYIRGYNEGEMYRLVRQRNRLGSRMFAEDLLTINKRIMETVRRHRKRTGF